LLDAHGVDIVPTAKAIDVPLPLTRIAMPLSIADGTRFAYTTFVYITIADFYSIHNDVENSDGELTGLSG
jgi:hypothetical protein